MAEGVYLILILASTQVIAFVINDHMQYLQEMTGIRSSMAVAALINQKASRLTEVTNQECSEPTITSLI